MTTATNTAANVETQTAAAAGAVEQIKDVLLQGGDTNTAAQPEVNQLTFVVQKGKEGTIAEYVACAEMKLIDSELVRFVRSIYRDIAADIAPLNVDAEITSLNKELLEETNPEKRLSILLTMQDLITQQKNEGSDIRTRLEDVPFEQIAVAYAEEFKAMLEKTLVDKLAFHHTATLKTKGKRAANGSAATTEKKAGPTVVVEFNGQKLTIAEGRGPLPAVLKDVIAAFAKEHKKEVKGIKGDFIAALKANKVKTVKFVEAKPAEA